MILSKRWLSDYVTLSVNQKQFMDDMTMSGSKVESFTEEGSELKNIVVGKICSLEKHPDSDHLWITQTDVGTQTLQIVTGAQNLKVGDIVPVALHNSVVHGGKSIKSGKLRGVESHGMLCSLGELGLTIHDFPYAAQDGIFVLGDDCCQTLGTDIREALRFDDVITEFEITPNRPDCLSVIGLAREASATFGVPVKYPAIPDTSKNGDINNMLSVSVEASDKCFRYCGAVVKNVRVKPSPLWLRERLRASGVRPISNIVDITNFVMLELGQPMHAFDYNNLSGHSIVVRKARENESITTLDGGERKLDTSMLVIADAQKPVAVAGVMGGEYSGITDSTNTIVFESAAFDGASVRVTAKKLGMRTESSSRFEKGLDREMCSTALMRALSLITELDAGDVVGGIIDCYPAKSQAVTLPFNPDWVNRFIGINVSASEQQKILESLEFKVENGMITVPSFREDVKEQADISEEIARFYGYQNIPDRELSGVADGRLTKSQTLERKLCELMLALGSSEIQTYSFISPKAYDKICLPADSEQRNSVAITNPLGEDTSVMRTTALPSMLEVLSGNYNNRNAGAFLFELASEYTPRSTEELPIETQSLVMGMYGENTDFYKLKGAVEELLRKLGINDYDVEALTDNTSYHPGRTALLTANGQKLGIIGQIHPSVADNYGIGVPCFAAQLCFDTLLALAADERTYTQLPKFPATTRDLALVCKKSLPVLGLSRVIAKAVGRHLESVKLFDVYEGEQIPEGMKSVAFTVRMRSKDGTLTDEDADGAVKRCIDALQKLGVSLRS